MWVGFQVIIYLALLLLFIKLDMEVGGRLVLPAVEDFLEAALAGLFVAFFLLDILVLLFPVLALEDAALLLFVPFEARFLCFLAGFVLTLFPMVDFDTMCWRLKGQNANGLQIFLPEIGDFPTCIWRIFTIELADFYDDCIQCKNIQKLYD